VTFKGWGRLDLRVIGTIRESPWTRLGGRLKARARGLLEENLYSDRP
jgi:hypothetical protein